MKWRQFKKDRIFLNYTVMFLPHSQKKPIHFKTPVWVFGLCFLGILAMSGTILFLAGSRVQLEEVRLEKEQLEKEWQQLALEKQQADAENETLKQARQQQEQELKDLEARTKDSIRELEELVERENQIRDELGLEQTQEQQEKGEGETEAESASTAGTSPLGSAVPSFSRTERTLSFHSIQTELTYLQTSLSQMSGQYETYLSAIEEKKELEAAEKARIENLREAIVAKALQYLGKAYVYGGTDPNTGVDCSGFTRYILSHAAGIYLNRTAAAQSAQGRTVSSEEARPGDLVFYSSGGAVDHVAIYIGSGRIVHASNSRVGIITSAMNYRTPVRIANMLGD